MREGGKKMKRQAPNPVDVWDICGKENAPFPEVKYTPTHFYVTFKPSFEYLELTVREGDIEVTAKVTAKVTENQERILEEIAKDKYITAKKLSGVIGISERKIKENMKKLKQRRFLKRIGPDRGGYWKEVKQ